MSDALMIGHEVDAAPPSRAAVLELGRLEAGRSLRSVPFWLGLAATGLYFLNGADGPAWQSETYQLTGSVAFGPVCAGIFVAAVLAGSRDRAAEVALAEVARRLGCSGCSPRSRSWRSWRSPSR
jgi:hypothetical protein